MLLRRQTAAIGLCLGLWAVNRFWAKAAVGGLFLRGYADDVLAGIILCAWLELCAGRWCPRWRVTPVHSLILVLGASVVFEGIWPLVFGWSVSDPLDVVAYLVGAGGWWLSKLVLKGGIYDGK